jgi:hypothetical protein
MMSADLVKKRPLVIVGDDFHPLPGSHGIPITQSEVSISSTCAYPVFSQQLWEDPIISHQEICVHEARNATKML